MAVLNASRLNGWDDNFKVLQLAINNGDPSTVGFPKATAENLGQENFGIGESCLDGTSDLCEKVGTKRLDLMMSVEQLADKRVNVLSIDVEGFDFEVLKGGNTTLRNTEYLEFELNNAGQVRFRTSSPNFVGAVPQRSPN